MLYDLLCPREGAAPWPLTIHFRAFPAAMLPPFGGEPALKASFLNSLKEAAFVARGSAMRVMEMSGGAQQDLWAAVLAGALGPYAQASAAQHADVPAVPSTQCFGCRPLPCAVICCAMLCHAVPCCAVLWCPPLCPPLPPSACR